MIQRLLPDSRNGVQEGRPEDDMPHHMTRAECEQLFQRILALSRGGGDTSVRIISTWRANLRWARNRVITSGESTNHTVHITRDVHGAINWSQTNKLDDESLQLALDETERILLYMSQDRDQWPMPSKQQYLAPAIWSDATFQLGADARSAAGYANAEASTGKQLLSAGYLEVGAQSTAVMNTRGLDAYYAGTTAQYSATVRNTKSSGSGWAGASGTHWERLDTASISQTAIQKCEASADPMGVEPGRYTVILEPQAVHDLMQFAIRSLGRYEAENMQTVYTASQGQSKIGQRVFDQRITIAANPMDPDLGSFPFDLEGYPYRPVTWIENGVLKELSYSYRYALMNLGYNIPLPNSGIYRMSGGEASLDDMIASAERALLVTRFSGIQVLDYSTLMMTGVSRDGLWLIERGKIKTPVKNLRFTDSPMFTFNSILQLGKPVPVFSPDAAAIVPPAMVRDFNFSSMSDAI